MTMFTNNFRSKIIIQILMSIACHLQWLSIKVKIYIVVIIEVTPNIEVWIFFIFFFYGNSDEIVTVEDKKNISLRIKPM